MTRSQYQRLPGRKSGLLRRDTLWLGSDHLLFVRSSRFTEDYRRFYLSEIQALVLQRRPIGNRRIVEWVAIGISILAAAALFLTNHAVWGSLLSIVVVLYGWMVLRREDCKTWVQTAVGTAELPPLCRTKSTMKALAILDEKIRAAQPAMPVEDLSRALETPPPLPLVAPVAPPLPPPLPVAAEALREPSRLYVLAFVFLLAFGVIKMLPTPSSSPLLWASAAGYLLFPALVMIPLVRHGVKNIRGARATAVLTSMVVTGGIGTYALSWATSRGTRKIQTADVQRLYQMMEDAAPLRIGLAAVVIALAIWGLLAFLTTSSPSAGRTEGPLTLFGPDRS
jgi:hypothetical protein